MRSLLLFAPSYAAAANRKIYELAEPGHGGVAFSSTEKLEEANRVCLIEAHGDRPLRIEYDPDANLGAEWLANLSEALTTVQDLSRCPVPSAEVIDQTPGTGRCRDCAHWARGCDMREPSGTTVGGKYVMYGMCMSDRNHGTGERDDEGKPMPMIYTLRSVLPRSEDRRPPGLSSWGYDMTPKDTTFNTREDFGCTNFAARAGVTAPAPR